MNKQVYQNSTEVMSLHGQPIYMGDVVDSCLYGGLNLFLQGDTGSGKTQLAKDAMNYFGDKSLFILGRNDMDTRELFQQVNPEFLRALRDGSSDDLKLRELTDAINYNLTVVDELPNCVPAVRAQLFNLFDGFIEIGGRAYPIGNGYSVGIATGNVGQQFTESSNGLGRALRDRMHVTIDVDYFFPTAGDTLDILAENTDPRVSFGEQREDTSEDIKAVYEGVRDAHIPLEKLIVANYLLHGLDHCDAGSKRQMKHGWPSQLENHEQGSDVGLVLPVSPRAAKSILRLSQALDYAAFAKGSNEETIAAGAFDSMMQAYRLVAPHSGVLNEAAVQNIYSANPYKAIDAVIATTTTQFADKAEDLAEGIEMASKGKSEKKVMDKFSGRWSFMKPTLDNILEESKQGKSEDS